jgi:hypothetical protein
LEVVCPIDVPRVEELDVVCPINPPRVEELDVVCPINPPRVEELDMVCPTNEGDKTEGASDTDGFGGRSRGNGLKPPVDSSVAPNGICARPTDIGDVTDGPACPGTDPIGAHPSDEAPTLPLLPKRAFDPVVVPAVIEQGAALRSDVNAGLRPGVASSVAPIGIPAGPTEEPGPIPSGEVMPSGEGKPPTPV